MGAFEIGFLDFLQTHVRREWLDALLRAITVLGNGGAIWIALGLLLLLIKRFRREGLAVCIALALVGLFGNLLLKPLIARARPCDVNDAIIMAIGRPSGYSFPSGHSASSFAAAFALLLLGCGLWKAAMPLAVVIAFSRMYLYVHYPSDVLGGLALGLLAALVAQRIARRCLPARAPEKMVRY